MKLSFFLRPLDRYRPQVFQVVVVAVMFAIGVWGHRSHWQFTPHAHADFAGNEQGPGDAKPSSALVEGAKSGAVDAPDASLIEFPTPESVEELGVRTLRVVQRPVSREVTAAGVVTYEPTRLAQLSAHVAGTVWRVEKQVGQTIRAGDVLAIIDAPAVGDAKADFLHSIADVQMCEIAADRLRGFAKGEVPYRQIQEAETALRKARVDRFNAQQALISLGLPINLDEWQALSEDELQRRIKFLGLPPSLVSQLDPNSTTATLLPLVAPFDGIVIGRELSKGEVVSPGNGHFEIADVSKMWIVLHVREQDVDDLQLGQTVTFRSGSASATGAVSWMSTAVDEKTRTVEVRCETPNPEIADAEGKSTGKRLLRANLFGVGSIQVSRSQSALVVPTKAVQRSAFGPIVFVPRGPKTFAVQPIQSGVVNTDDTEIVAGLTLADSVVVDGSHILKAELQRLSAAEQSP